MEQIHIFWVVSLFIWQCCTHDLVSEHSTAVYSFSGPVRECIRQVCVSQFRLGTRKLVLTSPPSLLPPTQLSKMDLGRNNWFLFPRARVADGSLQSVRFWLIGWSVKKGTHPGGCWGLGMKLKWRTFLLSDSLSPGTIWNLGQLNKFRCFVSLPWSYL